MTLIEIPTDLKKWIADHRNSKGPLSMVVERAEWWPYLMNTEWINDKTWATVLDRLQPVSEAGLATRQYTDLVVACFMWDARLAETDERRLMLIDLVYELIKHVKSDDISDRGDGPFDQNFMTRRHVIRDFVTGGKRSADDVTDLSALVDAELLSIFKGTDTNAWYHY